MPKAFGLYLAPAPQNQLPRKCNRQRLLVLVAILTMLGAGPADAKDKRNDPAEIGNRDVGKGLNFYSLEKEAALGQQMVRDVEFQSRRLRDDLVSEYVNRLCQNIVLNSDAKIPVSVQILDTEETNAFTLPGGHLYINAGLILKAETEAELAAALAHEIGHVAARHATRQATMSTIMDYGSMGLILIGGQAGFMAIEAARLAAPLGVAKFSRSYESEADFLGLQYVYKTGYDPTAFVDLLERLATTGHEKPNRVMGMLSTHPAIASRTRRIQQKIGKILPPKDSYIVNTSEFVNIRARLLELYAARRPQERRLQPPILEHRP
jgi:predicted Zn-dependent protease